MHESIALTELRKQIERVQLNSRGRRQFTAAVRTNVVTYAKRRIAEGASLLEVSREIGIHVATFSDWLRIRTKKAGKSHGSKLRRVEVKPNVEAPQLEMVLPSGVRIVGLELDQLLAVAKALS